jgi:hypothetical protein
VRALTHSLTLTQASCLTTFGTLVTACIESDFFTKEFIEDVKIFRRNEEFKNVALTSFNWGRLREVKSGYFRLCLTNCNFGGVRPFGNVSFPATNFIRDASICNATDVYPRHVIRRAAINIWSSYRNTVNDLVVKKMRRCVSMESIGILDRRGALESHKVFSIALSGSGFADAPTKSDVAELSEFISQAEKTDNQPKYSLVGLSTLKV